MTNALDRLIGWFSPRAGLQRAWYRQRFDVAARYDGASKGRRTEGWRAPTTSANTETRSALPMLRNRSRDLVRNNPWGAAAVREIPAHMVGEGIIPQARGRNPAQTERAERLVKAWFDTTACDAEGVHDFYGLQTLVARTVIESGECLVRRRTRRPSDGLPVPLQLQVLEPDHLDTLRDGQRLDNGNLIVQGIEYDAIGRRVAYWLFPGHPGEYWFPRRGFESRRIPASEILHIFRRDRPGQVRGVPWMAPCIIKLRDFADYDDAQLMRQKVAAAFAGFIYDMEGPDLGTVSTDKAQRELPEKIEPGALEFLPAGKRVEFPNTPQVEGFEEYTLVTLHSVATAIGCPYSVLTGDLRQVNFSSGRMGWISFNRNLGQWRSQMLIPQFCRGVWGWFAEMAQIVGGLDSLDAIWTPPRRELVDPSREIPAIRDAVRSGVLTQYDAIRQSGHDPEDFLREVEEANRRLDELGIVFDSDPRRVSRAGLEQPSGPDDPEE